MPLLRNKFQPYFPDPDSPNRYQCGSEKYCWPVSIGDRVMTQFYQTPCNESEITDPEFDDYTVGANIIVNPSFTGSATGWTLGAGWTWVAGNKVQHTTTYTDTMYQTGSGFVDCQIYRITIDITRTAGSVKVILGTGIYETQSQDLDETGSYTFDLYYLDPSVDEISIEPTSDFAGTINSIEAKRLTWSYWDPQCSWYLDNGKACWRDGGSSSLIEIVPNYILQNKYYKFEIFVEGLISAIQVGISDIYVNLSNGANTFYVTPTVDGVITIDTPFDQSDTVCISDIKIYELKKDYYLELVSSNGTEYDVSDSIEYYNEFVTIDLDINSYELADDCYTLNMYDQCIVTSDNLITNPDFVLGFTDWVKNNSGSQYSIVADQLVMNFNPFGIGDTDYITNGNFSSGAAWTINAGWTIAGGKAVHTPGNTGTMFQTLTLPAPPPPGLGFNYWVGFTVSNWTAGTISVKLGTNPTGTTYTWKGNDTFIQFYGPKQSGSVDIIFTPSTLFDGEIDDVKVVKTNHSGVALLYQPANPIVGAGTYQTEWEIVSSTDLGISAKAYLNQPNATAPAYQSAAGTYSYTQTLVSTGGNYWILVNFGKTDPNYIQLNYVEGSITIDNVSLQKIEPFEATYASECIQYNSNGFARTKMIVGYCDQNALGFDFENTGFKLMHRAEIRSLNPNYPSTSQIMKTGRGNDRFVYGELQKYWQVSTDFASETFHDTMAAILICDHFEIGDTENNTIEYSPTGDEYSPEWNADGSYSLATVSFQVRVKEKGQVFNRHI